ncbi:MAG TPA: BTAD domain-containing putative transcriptional regulator, partial [Longimicrobium sp.]|nr:BTAD domain-containing putative transcriptional regulator [Longimicrobium sp.]
MDPDSPAVSLLLLGTPVIRRDGAPVTGRAAYRRRLALLAVLAAARGRPVGRERLMTLLWPEHPPESARHTLSESLYVLRRELGEIFAGAGSEVALDPARVESDVEAFERALREGRRGEAVELYRGPFLDAFYVEGAPEFERWAEEERDRLARAFAGAVEALAEAAEAAGDPLGAAAWWRRLAAHDPYSSRVALRLVAALGRGGEAAAALRHAEAHAAFLREELGVGLDPELAALVDRLRAETVPLPPRPAPPPIVPPADPGPEVGSGPHPDRHQGPDTRAAADPDARQADPHPDHPAPHRPDPRPQPARAAAAGPSLSALPAPSAARRRGWRWAAAAGAVVLAAAGAAGLLRAREPAAARLDPHRIAVLYFDDHSAGGSLEYLAAGLTESLIHELSQVQALQVVSRNGVKPYRGGTMPLDSVVARLRVGSVVEGSVQRTGDSVRLAVQLVDAQTLAHLDSRVVVRPLDQVLALQDELSQEVASALRRRLGRELRLRQAREEAGSARALDAVLRAEQLRTDAEAVVRSADLRDAGSALALLARADSLLAAAQAQAPRWERPTVARGWVALQAAGLPGAGGERERLEAALAHAERALAG